MIGVESLDFGYFQQNFSNKKGIFSSLNPMQQVPALSVDGFTMSQSMAIIEYLDEKFPEGVRLFPSDLKRKFKVRQLCEVN